MDMDDGRQTDAAHSLSASKIPLGPLILYEVIRNESITEWERLMRWMIWVPP